MLKICDAECDNCIRLHPSGFPERRINGQEKAAPNDITSSSTPAANPAAMNPGMMNTGMMNPMGGMLNQMGQMNPMMQMAQMLQMMMSGGAATGMMDPSAVPFSVGQPVDDGDAGLKEDFVRPALFQDLIKTLPL